MVYINPKMMWSYKRDECDERIHLIRDEECIVDSFLRIGVVYMNIDGSCSVLKHGGYDSIKDFFEKKKEILIQSGCNDMASDMNFIEATNANIEDLNFILDRSALPEHRFQKLNAITIEADVCLEIYNTVDYSGIQKSTKEEIDNMLKNTCVSLLPESANKEDTDLVKKV